MSQASNHTDDVSPLPADEYERWLAEVEAQAPEPLPEDDETEYPF